MQRNRQRHKGQTDSSLKVMSRSEGTLTYLSAAWHLFEWVTPRGRQTQKWNRKQFKGRFKVRTSDSCLHIFQWVTEGHIFGQTQFKVKRSQTLLDNLFQWTTATDMEKQTDKHKGQTASCLKVISGSYGHWPACVQPDIAGPSIPTNYGDRHGETDGQTQRSNCELFEGHFRVIRSQTCLRAAWHCWTICSSELRRSWALIHDSSVWLSLLDDDESTVTRHGSSGIRPSSCSTSLKLTHKHTNNKL